MTKRGSPRKPTQPRARRAQRAAPRQRSSASNRGASNLNQISGGPAPGLAISIEQIKPWKHIVVWVAGVIIASLIPFIWIYADPTPGRGAPNIYEVLGRGDLYLIAIIVLIAGVTEIALILRHMKKDLTVALLLIGGFLLVLVDAARYANASSIPINTVPSHSVLYWSLGAFLLSATHSSICVGLAAGVR